MEKKYRDPTKRQITKISREVSKLTIQMMKEEGVGTAEFDFIHLVRHNPGITQREVCEALHIDKGAAARRTANLEEKGYLVRKPNPADGRSQLLYATEKAEELKNSKASIEAEFYVWLTEVLSEEDKENFTRILEKLYLRSKTESRKGFPEVKERIKKRERSEDDV